MSDTVFCVKCGKQLAPTDVFCRGCGSKQDAAATEATKSEPITVKPSTQIPTSQPISADSNIDMKVVGGVLIFVGVASVLFGILRFNNTLLQATFAVMGQTDVLGYGSVIIGGLVGAYGIKCLIKPPTITPVNSALLGCYVGC